MTEVTRRNVLAGAAGMCAAGLLAACGTTPAEGVGDDPAVSDAHSGSATHGAGGGDGPSASGAAPGVVLGSVRDVPVGGGKVYPDQKILVTQPSEGQFKAFGAVCPHQGVIVDSPAGNTITCPAHHSTFSSADGSVRHGPATTGLPQRAVRVEGGRLLLG